MQQTGASPSPEERAGTLVVSLGQDEDTMRYYPQFLLRVGERPQGKSLKNWGERTWYGPYCDPRRMLTRARYWGVCIEKIEWWDGLTPGEGMGG